MERFAGKRVLLVEDEAILAMAVEDMLLHMGCVVIGPALSASEAAALEAREAIDAAVLDINMGEGSSLPVARALKARGVPFCFSTGYGLSGVPAELRDAPVLQKPYSEQALCAMLEELLG